MERLRRCVICNDKLPKGARIDRRYCRESCRIRAYRRRHPDRDTRLRSPTRSEALHEFTSQLTAEREQNSVLRGEVETAQARIAELSALLKKHEERQRVDAATISQQTSAQKAQALRAEQLQADAERERQRTARAEQRIDAMQAQVDASEAELASWRARSEKKDAPHNPSQNSIDKAENRSAQLDQTTLHPESELEKERQRTVRAEQQAASLRRAAQESTKQMQAAQAVADERGAALSQAHRQLVELDEEVMRLRKEAARTRQPHGDQDGATGDVRGAARRARERDTLPWEICSAKTQHRPMPKWDCFPNPEKLEAIHELVEQIFSDFPEELQAAGKPKSAQQMRQWFADAPPLLRPLSYGFAERISFTDLAGYETDDERRAMLNLALKDTMEELLKREPSEAEQLEQFVEQNQARFERFIIGLFRRIHEASP